jgi:hypothetical protein
MGGEDPGEEGGSTEKKEATLPPPDSRFQSFVLLQTLLPLLLLRLG